MNISVISCPNGMGHFYRLLEITKILAKKNKIYFFCSKKQIKKLNENFKNISFYPILEDVNIEEKKINFLINFFNRDLTKIKKINDSNIIISDNLINKIYLKKKFILISNFFWGKNFKLKTKKYKIYQNLEKEFLKNNTVLQNRYFGNSYNYIFKKSFINFTGKKSNNNHKQKTNKIFFYMRKKLNIFPIIKILQNKFEIYSNSPSKKHNIKYHNLNTSLNEFSFLLGRPGLGIITDSVKFKIPLLSYIEENATREMVDNNKLIKKYRIGILLNKNSKSVNEVLNLNLKSNKYKKYINNLSKFKFNGEIDILNYVKKI